MEFQEIKIGGRDSILRALYSVLTPPMSDHAMLVRVYAVVRRKYAFKTASF